MAEVGTVHGNYFGFETRSEQSDMTLTVGGIPLYVDRSVLISTSEVFERIFDDKDEVTLDEEDAEGFCEFLACFYPPYEHRIEKKNVFRISPLAFKYDASRLMQRSVELLMESLTEEETEAHIRQCLSDARQHSITTMIEKYTELLIEIFKKDLSRADEILTLEADVQPVVMSAMIPILRSEASKYRFLSAGPKGTDRYMDLDDFHDAKYHMVSFLLNHGKVAIGVSPVECAFTLWNVTVDVQHSKVIEESRTYRLKLLTRDPRKYQYRAAIKMVFKTKTSTKEDICRQCNSRIQQEIIYTTMDLDSLGYEGSYKCTVEAHILMQKPFEINRSRGEEDD